MPIARLDVKSKFYIDPRVWERRGRDLRAEVYAALCDECKRIYSLEEVRQVDHIDPQTGEVTRMDALWECAMEVCAKLPGFIDPKLPLHSAIFRAFLAAGNQPLSAQELYACIKKGSPAVILKALLSPQLAEEGIVPYEGAA